MFKQKKQTKIQVFFYSNKENNLFFHYQSNHPKRLDDLEYQIGKFILFRKNKMYIAKLKSKPHLNPLIMWNASSFQKLLKCLSDFVVIEDSVDFSTVITLSVYISVKKQQIMVFKVNLNQQFSKNISTQMWNQFRLYNLHKSKYLKNLRQQTQKVVQKYDKQLDDLEKFQQQEKKRVNICKGKLSALVHEKQERLAEYTGEFKHLNYFLDQEKKGKENKGNIFSLGMSSQEDRMLVGSLFAPSQNFLL